MSRTVGEKLNSRRRTWRQTGLWCSIFLFASSGWMHSGYPIMCHLESVQKLISLEDMRSKGLWGPIHELGHNQQCHGWEFRPHTTEATCNLWSVYVHETVLGIPRAQAHPELKPEEREKRIRDHLQKGAPLSNWNVWTALETYLQVLSTNSRRRCWQTIQLCINLPPKSAPIPTWPPKPGTTTTIP